MRFPRIQLQLTVALSCVALATFCAQRVSAQQVTYYNFDTPATASPLQYSYTCSANIAPADVLFCFNYGDVQPGFIKDPSPDYAIEMTPDQANQAASVWFSVPQDVVDGFNVWFAVKFTASGTPADGLAFVIQNAASSGTAGSPTNCANSASGLLSLGQDQGGCIGYGGIRDSVALELDTFKNDWDPSGNHIALQSCGKGNPNSTVHLNSDGSTGACVVPVSSGSNPATPTGITLTDGNVHQIVMVYNGPKDPSPNTISVYLDPVYNLGTHTPVAGSVPLFTGPFDITAKMQTMAGTAYVGFTGATGADSAVQELMGWTFTPHATVTQQQTLNPAGSSTTFNFGTHSDTTTFPNNTPTTNFGMGVIATTITPTAFANLLGVAGGANQFGGSQCQVYDDTGGNCIIYSVYCYDTTSKEVEACPKVIDPPQDCTKPNATDAAACIALTAAYNNTIQPISPGYLQGDPLFSPILTIVGDGTTSTVTCVGECAVTAGQTISIVDGSGNTVYTKVTVLSSPVPTINTFAFNSTLSTTLKGGFLTSNNVQDIFTSYTTPAIDSSTGGRTQNFSDFVVTGATVISSQTGLAAVTTTPAPGQADQITATITAPNQGLLSLSSSPADTIGGKVSFSANSIAIADCQNLPVTDGEAVCAFTAPATIGPVSIQAQYSGDAYHQGSSATLPLTVSGAVATISPNNINFGTLYVGSIVTKVVTVSNTGNAPMTLNDPFIAFVGGAPSEFITLNLCPKSLAAGKSCLMTLTFIAGPFYTPQTATLNINDNAPGSPQTVSMTATVINPQAHLSANSLSFGTVNVGNSSTKSVTLTNTGGTQLSTIGSTVTGANFSDFTASGCPASLNPGNSCVVNVAFKPGAKGSRTATLVITDNAQNSPQKVALSGTGH